MTKPRALCVGTRGTANGAFVRANAGGRSDAALSILELRHGLELILGRVEDHVVSIA